MTHDRTLEQLGWPEVLAALSSRCRLPAGQRRALALPFLPDAAAAREALARVDEARRLSESGAALPFGGLSDVDGPLDRAARGGVLEPLALREVAALARAVARTRAALLARGGEAPRLAALAEPLEPDERLADRIERAIEPSGTVSDRASPELAAARERSRGLHRALKIQVETYLADPEMERHLRDRYFTIRNERYVLPILASARTAVPGIVHNASQSGQTLFVEPTAHGRAGERAGHRQRHRRRGGGPHPARALGRGDGPGGGAGGAAWRCWPSSTCWRRRPASPPTSTPTPPSCGRERDGFELLSLRHPLLVLQGKKVVASHVRMAAPARALIVSGPNGGGKTVAITAVGALGR